MGANIQSFLEKVRGLWAGAIEAQRSDRLLEIQRLEDELKSDQLSASRRAMISGRLSELKDIHFDDLE